MVQKKCILASHQDSYRFHFTQQEFKRVKEIQQILKKGFTRGTLLQDDR